MSNTLYLRPLALYQPRGCTVAPYNTVIPIQREQPQLSLQLLLLSPSLSTTSTALRVTMQLRFLLGAFALPLALAEVITTDVFYWPVEAPQPSVLARVSFDKTSLESDLLSYTPPSDTNHDDLVRIGLYTSTPTNPKQWSGSLVSRSSLTSESLLRLHLDPAKEVYHVSLGAPSYKSAESAEAGVELVLQESGPQPHLNRPVVLSPDGQNPEEVPEKSFIQK